jgi:hypothetical protein
VTDPTLDTSHEEREHEEAEAMARIEAHERDPDDYDDPDFDDEDDEWPADCHMHHDGQCGAAGSEWCEFECPVMAEWRREPWDENGPIKDDAEVTAGSKQTHQSESTNGKQ